MNRVLQLLILLLSPVLALAQPGGGGGLFIKRVYSPYLKQVDIAKDKHFKARTFLLDGDKIERETYVIDSVTYPRSIYAEDLKSNGIYFWPDYSGRYQAPFEPTNQRLLITYGDVVMLIDFIGVWTENGAGHVDQMDSLVIQQGHFVFHRSHIETKGYSHFDFREFNTYLRNGLTEYSIAYLKTKGYINHDKRVDAAFLDRLKFPTNYIAKAEYSLQINQPAAALIQLKKPESMVLLGVKHHW